MNIIMKRNPGHNEKARGVGWGGVDWKGSGGEGRGW